MSTLLSAKIQFSFAPFPEKAGEEPLLPGKSRTKSREKARKDRPETQKKLPCRSKGALGADEGT